MGHKRHPPVRLTEESLLILQNLYPTGYNSREAQLRFRLRHWPTGNLSQEFANIPDSTASTSEFVPTESPQSETPLSQAEFPPLLAHTSSLASMLIPLTLNQTKSPPLQPPPLQLHHVRRTAEDLCHLP
jgi:hypothetical protein